MTPMKCTCEHKIDEKDSHKILESILNNGDTEIEDDVASFVHLPSNTSSNHVHSHSVFQTQVLNGSTNDINGLDRGLSHEYNQGILNQDRHMKSLLLTTERILNMKASDSTVYFQDDNKNFDINNTCLCRKCITRVVTSINQNMEWMQSQTRLYNDAVEKEKESRRKLEKAMSIGIGIASESISDKLQRLEEESASLELQCKEQERELEQINMMLDEQLELAKQLTEQEEQLIHDFHSLEIESESFQSEHRRLTLQCHTAEKERYYLEHVSLHSAMFQIVVDNQGGSRSFPLMNGLRLTYRPKGDVPWDELNLAWSKVVQLILSIASSVGFQSANLRILPLVSCAKIIDVQHTSDSGIQKKVYNLGLDKTSMDRKTHKTENIISGITALHALLFQIMNHIDDCMDHSNIKVHMPYDIHPHTIGRFDLRPNLNSHHRDYEDVKWSGIVHCIASNLKWLSENCMTFRPITSKK